MSFLTLLASPSPVHAGLIEELIGMSASSIENEIGTSRYKFNYVCFKDGYPNPPQNICRCTSTSEGLGGMPFYKPPVYRLPVSGSCPRGALDSSYSCNLTVASDANICEIARSFFTDPNYPGMALDCPEGGQIRNIRGPYTSRKMLGDEDPAQCPPGSSAYCTVGYVYDCYGYGYAGQR